MVHVSILVPERATICHATMLEPFVTALDHELTAFAHLLENSTDHGFFITDPVMVNLHGYRLESKSSFNMAATMADQS